MRLQRQAGNRAVAGLLVGVVQRRPIVGGQPGTVIADTSGPDPLGRRGPGSIRIVREVSGVAGAFDGYPGVEEARLAAIRVPGLKAIVGDGGGAFHVFVCDRPLPSAGSVSVRSRRGTFEFVQWVEGTGPPSQAPGWEARMRAASEMRARRVGSGSGADRAARELIVPLVAEALGLPIADVHWAPFATAESGRYETTGVNVNVLATQRGLCETGTYTPRAVSERYPIVLGGGLFNEAQTVESIRGTYLHELAHARHSTRTNQLLLEWQRTGAPGGSVGGFHQWLRRQRNRGVSADDVILGEERSGTQAQPGARIDLTQVLAYMDGFTGTFHVTGPGEGDEAFGQLRGLARHFEEVSGLHMGRAVTGLRTYRSGLDEEHRSRFDRFVANRRSDSRTSGRLFYDWLATGVRPGAGSRRP